MFLNQTKFGKLVGCSQQNISKLIKKGILTLTEKKIDKDKGLQQLRDHGLLDENDKLIKANSQKKEITNEDRSFYPTGTLPLNEEVPYESYEYLSAEEIEKIEAEKSKLKGELERKQNEAASRNITAGKTNLEDIKYADAKTHREHFMGLIAELDYQIKIGEYVSKEDVETAQYENGRIVRDSLLALPNKMSLRIVGKTDIKEIESVLMEEILNVLENLSS